MVGLPKGYGMQLSAVAQTTTPWAAIIPVAVIALGFVAYCLVDLARSQVRYLPKWLWAVICLVSVPLGGIIYLLVGKAHR